jgi:hypothetical protein
MPIQSNLLMGDNSKILSMQRHISELERRAYERRRVRSAIIRNPSFNNSEHF